MSYLENEISGEIVDSCLYIHSQLGPGLFESVYEKILIIELRNKGLLVENQIPIPINWRGSSIGNGFIADLIVEHKVIVEIKSIENLHPVHYKQLLTYLRLSKMKLGLLINFKEALLKSGIKRVVNGL